MGHLRSTRWFHNDRDGRVHLLWIVALGAALRLAFLGNEALWRDEAFSALTARQPVGSMLNVVSHDSAPPLAYLIQHYVLSVWDSTASLRITSAVAGIVAIFLAAALGRRVAGPRGALWSALAMAILPSAVIASRDARMYSLATTLALTSALTLWRLAEKATVARWLVFTLACVACVYTDYFTAFAIAGELVAALLWLRPSLRTSIGMFVAAGIGAISLTPWLLYAHAQFAHTATAFWVKPLGPQTLGGVVMQFFTGPPADDGVPFKVALWGFQAIVVITGLVAIVFLWLRRGDLDPHTKTGVRFLATCTGTSLALLIAISLWRPLLDARYVSPMWGPMICLVGIGASLVDVRLVRRAGVYALLGCSVILALAFRNPNTPAVLGDIGTLGPHDMIQASDSSYLPIQYYGGSNVKQQTHIIAGSVPWYWGTAVYPSNALVPTVPADVTANHGTIYYIDDPGFADQNVPAGYHQTDGPDCASTVCVTTYRPS